MIPFESRLISIKDIEERNKAFHSLSDEDKRKEIAFDCFNLIISKKVWGAFGSFWSNDLHHIASEIKDANNYSKKHEEKMAKEFQLKLITDLPVCDVCARGGMMLSQIRLGNTISPDDLHYDDGSVNNVQGFSFEDFDAMENEYEGYNISDDGLGFLPCQPRTTAKLASICINVIMNGNFNIEDPTDYLVKFNIQL